MVYPATKSLYFTGPDEYSLICFNCTKTLYRVCPATWWDRWTASLFSRLV